MTFISQLKMSFVSRNEASFQELEIPFQLVITTQIRSLFLRSKTFFLESNLCFRNQTFVPGIEISFPQLKLQFSEQRFELSRNKQFEKSFECELISQVLNKATILKRKVWLKNWSFNSGNELANLNWNNNLERKFQLQKISGIEVSVPKVKDIFNKEANGQNGLVYHFHVVVVP